MGSWSGGRGSDVHTPLSAAATCWRTSASWRRYRARFASRQCPSPAAGRCATASRCGYEGAGCRAAGGPRPEPDLSNRSQVTTVALRGPPHIDRPRRRGWSSTGRGRPSAPTA